jgi:hypothetical protein
MPLNQLAFLSEWLALRMAKVDCVCRPLRPKEWHSHSTLGLRPEAEFSQKREFDFETQLGWISIVVSALSCGNHVTSSILSCKSETV